MSAWASADIESIVDAVEGGADSAIDASGAVSEPDPDEALIIAFRAVVIRCKQLIDQMDDISLSVINAAVEDEAISD